MVDNPASLKSVGGCLVVADDGFQIPNNCHRELG